MDMSTMSTMSTKSNKSSISMFSMYFVSCLGRGEGGGSSLSLLGWVTRPDFCSWPSRLFQAFRPAQHFSRYNLLPGQGVQQVTVPFIPWCYKLQNVRTRPLESVIGRRRALYNKRYQGDLLRLQKSDMKNLMALVFASTILFSNYGPTLSID